jgi:hypothetical protein
MRGSEPDSHFNAASLDTPYSQQPDSHFNIASLDTPYNPQPDSHLSIASPYSPQRCATPQLTTAFPTPPSSSASGRNYRGPRTPSETPVTSPGFPSGGSLSPEPEKEKPCAISYLTSGWLPATTSPPEARPLMESLQCLETQKFSKSRFSYEDWEKLSCLRRSRTSASRKGTIDTLDSEIALFIRALRVLGFWTVSWGFGLCHEILIKGFHDQ